jgi:hypothetical protein
MLAFVACGLAFLITRSVAANDIELWAYDFLVNHGGYSRSADNIVVVDFDNDAVTTLKQFPVSRQKLAEVIGKISSAKPRVIGLDFFLTEKREQAEDDALRKALTDAGNVIVASQLGAPGLPGLIPLPEFCQPEPKPPRGFCQDGTPGAMGFAFVNVPLDNDGYVRSMMLLPSDRNETFSFPLTIAQQYSGEAIQPAGHDAARFLGRRIRSRGPRSRPRGFPLLPSWITESICKAHSPTRSYSSASPAMPRAIGFLLRYFARVDRVVRACCCRESMFTQRRFIPCSPGQSFLCFLPRRPGPLSSSS